MLSIVITTYKRNEALKARIQELIPILCRNVVLHIFDDDPDNNISEIKNKYDFTHINYHQNKLNLGQSLNLVTNIFRVKEGYIFIAADDDNINSQKLQYYYRLCVAENITLIQFEFFHFIDQIKNKTYTSKSSFIPNRSTLIKKILEVGKAGNILFKKNVSVLCNDMDHYVGSLYEDKGIILKNILSFDKFTAFKIDDYICSENESYGHGLRYSMRVFLNLNIMCNHFLSIEKEHAEAAKNFKRSWQAVRLSLKTIHRCFVKNKHGTYVSKEILYSEIKYLLTAKFLNNAKYERTK